MRRSNFKPFASIVKPQKPSEDFPLFPHNNGCWAKKIRGKLHYFGPWNDPTGALNKYLAEKDSLHAGLKPRADTRADTIKELVYLFLDAKDAHVQGGELSARTFACYKESTDAIIAAFGRSRLVTDLRPDDFAQLRQRLAKQYGPHGLGTRIQCVRSVFKWAYDTERLEKPMRFGPDFKRPSKKTLRLHRAAQGPKLYTREEIRLMIDGKLIVGESGPELVAPNPALRAMILLGVNAGMGNADCGTMPFRCLDLEHGWLNFPRPKTGVDRRCPLWPETVEAIRQAVAVRPTPKKPEHADLVFVTKYGSPWHQDDGKNRSVTHELNKLLDALGIQRRKGISFYTLRHVFRTVADEARDPVAADAIMGHESGAMSVVYRERIDDSRLLAVANHVRAWLFTEPSRV